MMMVLCNVVDGIPEIAYDLDGKARFFTVGEALMAKINGVYKGQVFRPVSEMFNVEEMEI